ncbi:MULTISPECIES: hypothetical protein [unclassified Haladaptatus]|uniref:hypothetical protein n=1 Tax=unclassified Haladaptatus TaxID=2622732 RepID=UPI0023E7C5A7|nr:MULTISPECIES: hypothetical protein [unclassified Haladaptatus]
MRGAEEGGVDVDEISPLAWRLLRTAAGFEQREVERRVDDLLQAHVSMLEGGSRGLSCSRREALFSLYSTELSADQIRALTSNF